MTKASLQRSTHRRELIRRLGSSKFNYWFGYVANISLVIWLVGHAFPRGKSFVGPGRFAALAVAGLLSWTLAEFLLHRYVYHLWPSFLTEGHELHHQNPRALIGIPWYLTTIAVVVAFDMLTIAFDSSSAGIVTGACWLGYILYCVAHHGSHHWAFRNSWLVAMKRHHLRHHAHPQYNWGFTTSLWDVVFKTRYPRERVSEKPRDK